MKLENIIDIYGMNDYYDVISGRVRIFHLSMASYNECSNQTVVPVSEDGRMVGVVRMEGNYCGEHK